ncbi:MAG: uncharacterized protein PWQ91_390 [Eubacteriales bacterium]|nr:uncharacterized protein [Eubacteriales bacterium]MDN5363329.1 uncharacterized protein [Eubacteriales bacterium]
MREWILLWQWQEMAKRKEELNNSLRYLPELAEIKKIKRESEKVQMALAQAEEELERLQQEMEQVSEEIEGMAQRVKRVEAELYSNRARPGRELKSLQQSVTDLKRKQRVMEEKWYGLLERREEVGERHRQLTEQMARLKADGRRLYENWRRRRAEVEEEIKQLEEQMASIDVFLDPRIRALYEEMRAFLGPDVVVRLKGGVCSGCHTAQPVDVVRELAAGQVVRCERCGRVLIPPEEEENRYLH